MSHDDRTRLDADYEPDFDTDLEEGRKGGAAYAATRTAAIPIAEPYRVDWSLAVSAGLAATLLFTLISLFLPRAFGVPSQNAPLLLGTLLAPAGGTAAFWLGLGWLLFNGIMFTALYAGILKAAGIQSGWGTGLVFGLLLWLAVMLFTPVAMSIHPLVWTEQMPNPGLFLMNTPQGILSPILSLVAHLVFGITAGMLYKHAYETGDQRSTGDGRVTNIPR